MKTLRWIVACAAILAAQESMPDAQVGDLRFKMPPGWTRVEKQNVVALIPPGLPRGKTAYLALFPAADLNSGLRDWFDGQWKAMTAAYQVQQGGQPTPQSQNGLESIFTTATVADRAGTRWVLVFQAIQNGKRVQPLLFMSSALDLYAEHSMGLQTFFTSLRLGPSGSPLLETHDSTPVFNGRLDGIYRGLEYGKVVNKAGSGYHYQVFYPDGRYSGKMPDQGMDNDDTMDMRASPLFWGTYTVSGNQGTIVFPVAMPYRPRPDVSHFTVCQGGLLIDPADCKPDPILTSYRLEGGDGARLQGTFRRPDYRMQYGPKQGILFTPDGRFADDGILIAAPVAQRDARGNYKMDDGRPGSGTYRVGHYTLTLSYSDRRVKRVTFYLEPGPSKTDVREFYISTWKFVRVQ